MSLEIRTDPLGFPMILVPEVELFVHWYPITKLQFETFLCDVLDASLDAKWYEETNRNNPRIPTAAISSANFWRAFMTGISAEEAKRFARWCGDAYRLPRAAEWIRIFEVLRREEPRHPPLGPSPSFANLRFQRLLSVLDAVSWAECHRREPANLAASMLLVGGILEWVVESDPTPGPRGCGSPHPCFFPNVKLPEVPIAPLHYRRVHFLPFGARLVLDPSRILGGGRS